MMQAADECRALENVQEVHSYPATRAGVPFLVDVRLLPNEVVIEADAPTLTKDDVKVSLPAAPSVPSLSMCRAAMSRPNTCVAVPTQCSAGCSRLLAVLFSSHNNGAAVVFVVVFLRFTNKCSSPHCRERSYVTTDLRQHTACGIFVLHCQASDTLQHCAPQLVCSKAASQPNPKTTTDPSTLHCP